MLLREKLPWFIKLAVSGLAGIGLAGVLPVSFAELRAGQACPHLGPIPACHLVSLAYGFMLAAGLSGRIWSRGLFFAGWIPVFILAAGGSALEVFGHNICPKTASEIPKCFFSLGLAVAIILPLLLHWHLTARRRKGGEP